MIFKLELFNLVAMQPKQPHVKTPRIKSLEWFSFLFTTFAIILFAVAVFLNHSYHATSLKSMNAELMEDFQKAASDMKLAIMDREKAILKTADRNSITQNSFPDLNIYTIVNERTVKHSTVTMSSDKFRRAELDKLILAGDFQLAADLMAQPRALPPPFPPLNDGRIPAHVVPSFLAPSFTSLTPEPATCRDAFTKGLLALVKNNASLATKHFAIAGLIAPGDEESRQIALWSYIHLIKQKKTKTPQRLHYLLYLIFEASERLTPEVTAHLESIMRKEFSDYEEHKTKSVSIWALAENLNERIRDQAPPIRMIVNGKIVSAISPGILFVFKIDWAMHLPDSPFIRLSRDRGDSADPTLALPLQFLPSYKLWVSRKTFEIQSRSINRQYLVINGLLSLLVILIVLFTVGTVRLIREENDLARLRSRFVATVSHELRTPLSLIQLYSETLFKERIDPTKRNDYLQTIVSETQRLTGLVNNVIDFSRLENKGQTVTYSSNNISELSWNVIQKFKYRLNIEGFRINVNIHPDVKAHIDPQAFCRVLFNLLDNAIKYSEKEKYIALDLAQTEQSAILKVTDHGMGIPVDAKPFVYLDYYRVDDPRVASQRGSGIGLSVVKQLLHNMHATIEMNDAEPTGTVFTVTIPREQTKKDKTEA